ncbi:MAG: CBS domain-containing protein [Anaerolineae bacterium]|nr:CBS domain-containing protein [Anaerolineae bacterium]
MTYKTKIGDWMKPRVISIQSDANVKEAAQLMVDNKVGTLPVLDEQGKLVGELSIADVVDLLLPDFVSLVENIDFVKDFGAFKIRSHADEERAEATPVTELMEDAVSVEADCSLVRGLSIMRKHNLRDVPVIRDDQLVGLASWVDLGRAFLEHSLFLDEEDEE